MKLPEFVKQRRTELGLTQKELAEKLGMSSAQHLCNIENGSAPMPPKYYKKLKRVLRIDKTEMILRLLDDYELHIREWL